MIQVSSIFYLLKGDYRDAGVRVEGSGVRVQGLGFGVRVEGLGA